MTWAEDVEDVLGYSTQHTARDVRSLLLGGVVTFVWGASATVALASGALDLHPVIAVVAAGVSAASFLAATGYLVRATRNAALDREGNPGFRGEAVVEGVFYWLALLPWLAVLVAAMLPAAFIARDGWLGFLAGVLYASLVVLVWVYVYPAVTLAYCAEGWRAAYGRRVWRLTRDRKYVVLSLVYHAVASVVVLVLAVSFLTFVLWAWVWFLYLAWSAAFWGRSYRRIME